MSKKQGQRYYDDCQPIQYYLFRPMIKFDPHWRRVKRVATALLQTFLWFMIVAATIVLSLSLAAWLTGFHDIPALFHWIRGFLH
jgi:hypothetical protein